MTGWRCLFWVQSLLGTGHLRRALTLADAMAARGAQVTLVNGGPAGVWAGRAGVELVQLPPVHARGSDFRDLVDGAGAPVAAALWDQRRGTLLQLAADTRPQVLVTEMFPFGRRAFRGELLPLLAAVRGQPGPPVIAASVRDILVSKRDAQGYAWMTELAESWYDRVLVHGDERLMPFAASFPPAGRLAGRIVHTGFVDRPSEPATFDASPAVLVSAGGGAVGGQLLRAALAARTRSRFKAEPWLLVSGPNLAEAAFTELTWELPAGCRLVRHRADLPELMGHAQVSVSQAGYNTVVEGLRVGARMVLVPFAEGGEDEQTRRAQRLAALGIAETMAADAFSGRQLAAAIDRAAHRPRPDPGRWSFAGAARSAEILAGLIDARRLA